MTNIETLYGVTMISYYGISYVAGFGAGKLIDRKELTVPFTKKRINEVYPAALFVGATFPIIPELALTKAIFFLGRYSSLTKKD